MSRVKQGWILGLCCLAGLLQLGGCRSSSQAKKEVPEATAPLRSGAPPPAAATPVRGAVKPPPAGGWVRLAPSTSAPLAATVRAFFAAARKAQDDPSAEPWLREALDEAKVSRLAAPVPASVQRAAAALQKWAASGDAVSIGERSEAISELLSATRVARALSFTVERSDAPMAAALLRFSHALRDPGNTAIAIAFGSTLAAELATHVLELRHQAVTEPFRTHALTEQDALNLGRSFASGGLQLARMITLEELQREAAAGSAAAGSAAAGSAAAGSATVAGAQERDGAPSPGASPLEGQATASEIAAAREKNGLPVTGDWLADDLAHYQAFWDETEHLVATATTAAEMSSVLERRTSLAVIHPTSMLVRLVGHMTLSTRAPQMVAELAERARAYQALLAATAAAK
jgi:hypothetical protein